MHSRSNGRNIAFIVLCHVASLRGILGPVNLYRQILGLSSKAINAWPLRKNLISSRSRSCTTSMRLAINWTHRSRVELFRLVDWVQPCGTNQGHSARRLTLHGDEGLVTSICLASAFLVAANGEPLGVSPRCAAIPLAAVGDIVVCLEVQPGAARHASLLRLSTQTNLHAVEIGERN